MLAHPIADCFVNLLDEFSPGLGLTLGCFRSLFVHFGESAFHFLTGPPAGEAALRSAPGEAALRPTTLEAAL